MRLNAGCQMAMTSQLEAMEPDFWKIAMKLLQKWSLSSYITAILLKIGSTTSPLVCIVTSDDAMIWREIQHGRREPKAGLLKIWKAVSGLWSVEHGW